MVICLEQGAHLHMVQLMPLPVASVKSRLVLPFWYLFAQVVPEKRLLNGYVCMCVCVRACIRACAFLKLNLRSDKSGSYLNIDNFLFNSVDF